MIINRNLKTLDNKTGAAIRSTIAAIISDHEYHKNCYFWSPPSSASARRAKEFSRDLEFILSGKRYSVTQSLSCSCRNMYFSTSIYVDGAKKDIRSLKVLV